VPIQSDEERVTHYRTEWHRYNVKRRCAGLGSIPHALFQAQLAALSKRKAAESQAKTEQYCKVCKKSFASASAFSAHQASKKHMKKAAAMAEKEEEAESDEEAEEGQTTLRESVEQKKAPAVSGDAGMDMEDDDDEEYEDEEEEGEPIPLLHCLFCSKSNFASIESSVQHMLKYHGFFIPFIENLVDLEGLLTYLGEKVGIGHVCLWCNGKGKARYPSTRAVQQHMEAKSHCKLRLEDEEDEDELMEYYDFDMDSEEEDEEMTDKGKSAGKGKKASSSSSSSSSSAAASSSSSSTALIAVSAEPRRSGGGGASGINEAGELILADGSIVGTRQLKHIYRQHVRPSREVESIARNYKQLALTTNVKENPRVYRRAREFHHVKARKREELAKGLHGNFQHHFRAQVMF